MRPDTQLPTRARSTSRTRTHTSRPTTPLRPPSRTPIRNVSTTTPTAAPTNGDGDADAYNPLEKLEPAFAELADSMADLEANMLNLQILNESVARFNENFASLLYGLNMSAFCVDFSEAPGAESFKRAREQQQGRTGAGLPPRDASAAATTGWEHAGGYGGRVGKQDVDATFLTTDTSFVENPPASIKSSRYTNPMAGSAPSSRVPTGPSGRGRGAGSSAGSSRGRGGSAARGTRGSTTRGSTAERRQGR